MGSPEDGGGRTSEGRYTSVYYETQVLTNHPEGIGDDWIERAVFAPDRVAINSENQTISYWALIPEMGKSVRVVLRERDGTLINRFFDSGETRRRSTGQR